MGMADAVSLQLSKRGLEFCDGVSDAAVVTGNANSVCSISVFS